MWIVPEDWKIRTTTQDPMELYDAAEVFTKVLWIMYGLGGVVCLSIIAGWPTAQWLSERLAYFLSAWPDEKYDVPPPRLAMAASLAAQGDLEGALTFYEKLMQDHPQEEEVYHRMLEIVLGPLDRPAQAEEILHRGLTTLEAPRAQAALVRLFGELKAGTYRPMVYLRKADDARGTAFPAPRNVPVPPLLRPVGMGR